MVPFYILLGSFLVLYGLGKLRLLGVPSIPDAFTGALVIMFAFTGITHFTAMKQDYFAMLPAWAPQAMGLIYLAGALELAGAAGLAIPRFRKVAAICLMLLLVALFPANLNAAINDIQFRGRPPTALWLRTAIQAVYISLLAWVALREFNRESPSNPSS